MRALAWVLLGCGCNQVFGLRETEPIDAQQFDAAIDAPYACPPPGTQPAFAASLQQVIAKYCVSYTTSETTNRAAAYCLDLDAIADGAIGEVPERATLTPGTDLDWPRLTPEGDELWVRRRGATPAFAAYQYASDHHWTFARDVVTGIDRDDLLTTPSRRVGGVRRFLRYAFAELKLYEYSDDGGTTKLIRTYDVSALGTLYVQFPNLDADGLRLVFVGQTPTAAYAQTFYAERASIDAPFTVAAPLATAPVTYDPFLAADCSRLYTSGLGSIFYVQQL